jgi:hypothetical protein
LPAMPGVELPPRPRHVIPVQNGDVTMRHRRIRLP